MTRVAGSIYRRLILQLVSAAAILAGLLFLLFQSFARDLAVTSQDRILRASAEAIIESVSVQEGGYVADIPYAAFSMLETPTDDRVFYSIFNGERFLSGYEQLRPNSTRGLNVWTQNFRGDSVRAVAVARAIQFDGNLDTILVTVAQTQDSLGQTLSTISRTALLIGAGFFAIATALAVWAARANVRPLTRLAQAVSRRGPGDLRPVTASVPSEMAPLVGGLNAFMGRLGRSLLRSEEFITEAAHRVRTPLATVKAEAEITLRRVDKEENRQSLKAMIRAVDEASRSAGQLLDHAMVAVRTDHLASEAVDFSALVADVIERQRPLATLRDITLKSAITGAQVKGDPILLQNAVTNLIDNAVKYAPEESEVDIALTAGAQGLELTIADQGPGFPAGTEDLTQRYARGDNAGQTVGSGLGLTIASEVARAHGGSLSLSNNKTGGGACVTLSLPS